MPLRPLKQCKVCNKLTRDVSGYCEEHKDMAKETHKEYKNNRTDKKEQSFYNSKQWINTRAMALARDHGLCQHCLKEGKVTAADVVHHKIPIKVNWLLRLVLSNLISLCNSCHQKEHKGS